MNCLRPLLALVLTSPLLAQATVVENQKLVDAGGGFLDFFGRDVALRGDTAVVSALADNDMGSARIFQRSGGHWGAGPALLASDAGLGDRFGSSVAMLEGTIFVGANGDDDGAIDTGSVYVYDLVGSSWQESAKLHASDPAAFDNFGLRVAAHGDVLVVGAPEKDEGAQDGGAAYVFRKQAGTWVHEQKLSSPSPGFLGGFGTALGIDGDVIVIGASSEDTPANDAGAAYVYRWNGAAWLLEQSLTSSDGSADSYFGTSVSVDGDRIAVGAYRHPQPFPVAGAVYVYRWSGAQWVEEAKLAPGAVAADNWFGWSVDLEGDRLAVGAIGHAEGAGSGAAYQFHHDGNGWVEAHRWVAQSPGSAGGFLPNLGFSIDLDGTTVFAGAPWADGGAVNSGAAYVFEATELALDALPDTVSPGQELELRTYGGLAGGDLGLVITEVDGLPTKRLIWRSLFDAEGRASLVRTVPLSLSGTTIKLRASGAWEPSVTGSSNEVTLRIL